MAFIFPALWAYARLMRLDKPVGTVLFIWPGLWGLWIAAQGSPHLKHVFIFIAGAFIMRSAGCVVNDIADRAIDPHVKRTQHRPLAQNEISLKGAFLFFLLLLTVAFGLVLQLHNEACIKLAFLIAGLSCLYPFTKRWVYCPQLFLGLAVSGSVLMAFAVETGRFFNGLCFLVYAVSVLWSIMYDTQYAMMDKVEDAKLGVYSTALWFGRYDVFMLLVLQIILLILWVMLGFLLKLNEFYFISLFIVAILFVYQIYLIKNRAIENCLRAFLNNQWVGFFIFLGLFFSYFFK